VTSPAAFTEADAYPAIGEAIDFLRLLWAVDHDLQQKSIQMHRSLGVTGPQRLVIRIVGRFPDISLGRLAGFLGAHPSTATGLTKRLVQRGFLRGRRDPRDARRLQLRLTPRGHAIEKTEVGTIEEAVRELLASAGAEDIATTRAVLERFQAILSGTTRVRRGRARS
jgi:DNA-binding MarR family transcriptional regulator